MGWGPGVSLCDIVRENVCMGMGQKTWENNRQNVDHVLLSPLAHLGKKGSNVQSKLPTFEHLFVVFIYRS
jgi:hypothetical protein